MSDHIIFKDFQNIVPMIKDRWTPIYLDRGRLEVDNYSLKWISGSNEIAIPSAMVSCILLGPGSTITHAAIVSCSKTNTPIAWIGDEGLYYYATGVNVNENCKTSIKHAELYVNNRESIARNMFALRFPDIDVSQHNIQSLMGMEGYRVRATYKEYADKYNIQWVCRNTNGLLGIAVDDLNLALNILNYNLYGICLSAITTMGYIPSLGFIHVDGKIPFVYDIADLYKIECCIDVAFSSYSKCNKLNKEHLIQSFTERVSDFKLLDKLPKDLKKLIK